MRHNLGLYKEPFGKTLCDDCTTKKAYASDSNDLCLKRLVYFNQLLLEEETELFQEVTSKKKARKEEILSDFVS